MFRERWKAVEEIQRQELRAMAIEEHWRRLIEIRRFASHLGLERGAGDSESKVFERWARLKEGK